MSGEEEQIRSPRALFAQRFSELYAAAGNPTLRRVASATEHRMRAAQGTRPGGASAQRISDWKAGRNVPARFESLLPVVLTLIDLARKLGHPLDRRLAEPKEWQRLWKAATTWNPEEETDAPCPYPGLTAYHHDNRDLFFGRTRATAELTTLVRETTGIIVVIGASGAGKSSLLAAGLIPALTDWETTLLTPGPNPLDALRHAVAKPGDTEPDSPREAADLAPRADGPRRLLVIDQAEELFTTCATDQDREDFLALLDACATRTDDPITVVLALRADFYAHCLNHLILQDALEHRSYLLGPMRTDELAQAISGPARVAGLELEPGLEELVITELCGAADHHGRRTYDPGALPLLSHVMAATWQHREGRRLTITGYRKAGGVVGSVAETAEYAWNELSPAQRAAAREILLGLVTVGRDSRDTRRPGLRADLVARAANTEDATAALELLSRTRLITLDAEAVNLTHEIVLTAWPRLRTWIDEDRVGYLVRQRLETDAAEWAAQERDSALLYRGTRLRNALDNVDPPPVGPLAREFLDAATTARRRSRLRSRRTTTILALLGVALLVAGFGAYNQNRLANQRRDDQNFAAVLAEADRVRSVDPSLAAQLDLVAWRMRPNDQTAASTLLQTQNQPLVTVTPMHAQAVYKIAYRKDGKLLGSISYDNVLRLSDTSDPRHPQPLGQTFEGIGDFAFSPDGTLLVTAPAFNAPTHDITLWDISAPPTPRRLNTLASIPGSRSARVAFAPEGRTLATVTTTELALWTVTDPAAPVMRSSRPLHAAIDSPLDDLRYSPNGRLLALVHYPPQSSALPGDATIQLWSVTDPAAPILVAPVIAEPAKIRRIAFSPDSSLLAIGVGDGAMHPLGNNDGVVELWDIGDPARPRRTVTLDTAIGDSLWSLDFSPDGHTLAVGSSGVAGLWNITDPGNPTRLTDTLSTSPGRCRYSTDTTSPCSTGPASLAFAPDGRTLTAGGWTGDIRVWSLPSAVLTEHSAWTNTPMFDASGTRMATLSSDGRIALWDAGNDRPPALLGEYRVAPALGYVSLSPDGKTIMYASDLESDSSLKVFDATDSAHIRPLAEWRLPVSRYGTATVSPDWRLVAAIGEDRLLRFWDIADRTRPTAVGTPIPLSSAYDAVMFGYDGKSMVVRDYTRDGDKSVVAVTLWNIADPTHPQRVAELLRAAASTSAVITPDLRTMVVTTNETVQSWDISDPGHPVRLGDPIAAHSLTVRSVHFSADSRTMLTSGDDGGIQLWDFTDRAHPKRTLTLADSGRIGWNTTLTPDGRRVAAGGRDGALRLWNLDEQRAADRICAVTGAMSEDQWRRHLPQLPYRPPCPAS
ncbi:hypothetical protein JMUB6875_65770 [Nocardia sp. JMUB6875]|uniref:nSTAND1 domain-containing NTPase n=1 Tax=Nocardia sp. JMUB6875 TaxID=3158170 RepID=UPI0032E64410